jgi:hypothetical protein
MNLKTVRTRSFIGQNDQVIPNKPVLVLGLFIAMIIWTFSRKNKALGTSSI